MNSLFILNSEFHKLYSSYHKQSSYTLIPCEKHELTVQTLGSESNLQSVLMQGHPQSISAHALD